METDNIFMNVVKKCPTCDSELLPDALEGLCVKCLGRLAFYDELDGGGQGRLLRLGDYEVLEEIARGGMGVVYRARQLSLNRIVALKVVLQGPFSSPDFVRRFQREAEVIATLRHPNIVTVYDVGEHQGTHYLALEYVEGRSFAALARDRPLPARTAADYVKTVAGAVEHAHRRGVLHRDLKPSNILLDSNDQPRVTDFGLAKMMDGSGEMTAAGQVLGSPDYMPPEQAAGGRDNGLPQSDVYSLGAILYELLTGRPPFQGESLQSVLAQAQSAEPVPPRRLNPGVPPDLETICLKCLQKEPGRRYDSAQALADDLGRFLEGEPILARPVSPVERSWLWCKRRPLLAALAGSLAAAVVLGVGGILWEWRQAETQRQIAEKDAAETRLNLYAADVAMASQAIQNGDLGSARRALDGLRPAPGESELRGFEWRYLRNLCRGDQLATLAGHSGIVTCAAFSPDGRLLATGSQDGTTRIWDVPSRQPVGVLTNGAHSVWSVAFTPDGKELMTGTTGQIEFWDTGTWRRGRTFPGTLATLSKIGSLMASTESSPYFWEPAGRASLWDWQTGRLLRQIDRTGRAVALSDDGRRLALAETGLKISLWDATTGGLVKEWPVTNEIWSLHFSPDGTQLISTAWSSNVMLWPVEGDSPPRMLASHRLHVWSAVFSDDSSAIATASSDQSVQLWDAASLRQKMVLHGHSSEVWCAAFSPDGQTLATGGKDENVLLWSAAAAPASLDLPHDTDFRPLFSPDGKWLVTVNPDTGHSVMWNASDSTLADAKPADGRLVIGFSRDAKCVASFDSGLAELDFWPPGAATPSDRTALGGMTPTTERFAYDGMSPAQDFFFTIDKMGVIRVWNVENGKLARTIQGPMPPIRNAVLSPGGRHIAVAVNRENAARLYDCRTGAAFELRGHKDFVSGLAFSPDDRVLATGSMDGTIRLWNTATGKSVGWLPGHVQETTDLAFSPDGRTLASLGHGESLKLWHLPTLREVVSRDLPQAGIWLAFSPDGSRLAVETTPNKLQLLAAPWE